MRVRPAVFLLVAAGVLASSGCGGGGGNGNPIVPVVPPVFQGPYHLAFFRGTTQPADVAASLWGIMTSDGVAALTTGTTDQNENGVLSNPVGALNGTFTIAADGSTSWLNLGTEVQRGGTTAAMNAQVVGSVRAGVTVSSMAVLLRRGGTFSAAALTNRYRFCAFAQVGGTHVAAVGNLAFDGVATAQTTTVTQNTDGTVTTPGTVTSGAYAVSPDGDIVLNGNLEGGILSGNDVMILGGTNAAAAPPFLVVAVRTQAGATDALFMGTYAAVFYEFNVAAGRYRVLTATAVADGAGTVSVAGSLHQEGTVAIVPAANQSYSVNVDGTMTMGSGLGAVSPDGTFAVLGGGTANGQNPTLAFFLRK